MKSHFELNKYFDKVETWSPTAIETRGKSIAQRALMIWPDVGRDGLPQADPVVRFQKPVAVHFRGHTESISSWKQGAIKLVEMFEAAHPGLLASIVAMGELPVELSDKPDQFLSKAQIGGVYFNSHASSDELKRRMRKIAKRADIGNEEYGYVMPHASNTAM